MLLAQIPKLSLLAILQAVIISSSFCLRENPNVQCWNYQKLKDLRFDTQTSCSGVYSRIDNSLLFSEDTVKHKACHCKDNACSSQDGEDDSECQSY